MKNNRTGRATKSMSANGIYYIINIILGLVNRRFLILIMGIDYQGVNGLFTSVLSVLEMAELGIGTAIVYHLYKPLAEDDKETIKSLMQFYRKCYFLIALVISIVGCLLCTNIEFFVGKTTLDLNLKFVFLFMLADVIGTYTLAYKRSILYADQKNYIVANVNTVFVICYNVAQIVILFLTQNYYLYLASKVLFRIGSNVIVNIVVNKLYPYLREQDSKPLSKEILSDIALKVKGLMCHKIGTFIVNGTDNIFISKLVDIATVGIYANYNYVIMAANSLMNQVVDGATASVGNLLVKSDEEHKKSVFEEMNLLNILISTIAITVFSVAIDDFIAIFFGSQFKLQRFVLVVLIINMIFVNLKRVWGIMKTAAGIQYEDRWVPVYESIINLIMSYTMFKFFGLAGIFMGTLFTHLGAYIYTFPKLVAKKLFNSSYYEYCSYMIKQFAFQATVVFIGYVGINIFTINNIFVCMLTKTVFAVVWSIVAFLLCFSRSKEFRMLFERIKVVINGRI